jgi:hypothetical protein
MSIVQIPEDLSILRQDFGIRTFDFGFEGSDTGATQVVLRAPPRRTCTIVSNDRELMGEGAAWRVLLHALRGRVNSLAVYDINQPEPRGTARGAWTSGGAAAGAASMIVDAGAAQAGQTLLAGDWIGVNQLVNGRQLLHVQADAVVDGSGRMLVVFEPVLRLAVAAGSTVVWQRPTCLMRRTSGETSWSTHPGEFEGGFSLDLMEDWQ